MADQAPLKEPSGFENYRIVLGTTTPVEWAPPKGEVIVASSNLTKNVRPGPVRRVKRAPVADGVWVNENEQGGGGAGEEEAEVDHNRSGLTSDKTSTTRSSSSLATSSNAASAAASLPSSSSSKKRKALAATAANPAGLATPAAKKTKSQKI